MELLTFAVLLFAVTVISCIDHSSYDSSASKTAHFTTDDISPFVNQDGSDKQRSIEMSSPVDPEQSSRPKPPFYDPSLDKGPFSYHTEVPLDTSEIWANLSFSESRPWSSILCPHGFYISSISYVYNRTKHLPDSSPQFLWNPQDAVLLALQDVLAMLKEDLTFHRPASVRDENFLVSLVNLGVKENKAAGEDTMKHKEEGKSFEPPETALRMSHPHNGVPSLQRHNKDISSANSPRENLTGGLPGQPMNKEVHNYNGQNSNSYPHQWDVRFARSELHPHHFYFQPSKPLPLWMDPLKPIFDLHKKLHNESRDATSESSSTNADDGNDSDSDNGPGRRYGSCPTLLHCLGRQACVFHLSNEFCRGDPVPLFRKTLDLNLKCERDHTFEGHVVASKRNNPLLQGSEEALSGMKHEVVFLKYQSKLERPLREYNSTQIEVIRSNEERVFDVSCPPVTEAATHG